MDTFIGSADRGKEGSRGRERKAESEKERACNGPRPMQASGPAHAAKPDSSVSDNTQSPGSGTNECGRGPPEQAFARA